MVFIFEISSAKIRSSLAKLTCCRTNSWAYSRMALLGGTAEFNGLAGRHQFDGQDIFQIFQNLFSLRPLMLPILT